MVPCPGGFTQRSVGDKHCCAAPRQAVLSWESLSWAAHVAQCVFIDGNARSRRAGSSTESFRGCVPWHSLTVASFCIHFSCVGGFFSLLTFFFFFPFFFLFSPFLFFVCVFFLKPTWQHQRSLPLLMASYSSLPFLAGTLSAECPNTAVPLCARQNALLRGMSLLACIHLWVCPATVKLCRAEPLLWAFGLRSSRGIYGRSFNVTA